MTPAHASKRAFAGVSLALFTASAALTITWCRSMSAMHDMPMPGGWDMSMMWMHMPGQTWPGSAMLFLGMWLAMMIAMMLPVLTPALWRYARALTAARHARVGTSVVLAGAAYFFVWTLFGALTFLVGTLLATWEMRLPLLARAVPAAIGALVLIAGLLQFSAWKARHLACCRGFADCCADVCVGAYASWRHGLRLGMHCVHCCLGLTTVLLAVGVMDLRAMALVSAAICVERLAPGGARAARFIGVILIAAGVLQIARAIGI